MLALRRSYLVTVCQMDFVPLIQILLEHRLANLHQSGFFASFLLLELVSDRLIDDSPSFLQQFDPSYEVVILEVAACHRVLVLSVNLRHNSWLVRICGLHSCVDDLVQHVDPDEVGHFSIHDLPVEQLKREVQLLARAIAMFGLHLHVIEVHFALADPRGHLLALGLGRYEGCLLLVFPSHK